MMKSSLVLFLLIGTTYAQVPNLEDYGKLLYPNTFLQHCVINDSGISGSATVDVYTNGQVDCITIQNIYTNSYVQIHEFLSTQKYDFSQHVSSIKLQLRILTLAQMNNPMNFGSTNSKCMYNSKCQSGAYYGGTFPNSSNINIYVVYPRGYVNWRFSFVSTIKHELMHAILYRYHWNLLLGKNGEHVLIDKFLEWDRK